MRTMTNPQEFVSIQMRLNEESFLKAIDGGNFRMRELIASFGFKAPRELASEIFDLAKSYRK